MRIEVNSDWEFLKVVICLFRGHNWSGVFYYALHDKMYSYCCRCGRLEVMSLGNTWEVY